MAEALTLASAVGLEGPVFLRKLRRRADWGSNETPQEERAADLLKVVWKCEPHPESPFSVYLVSTDEEFQKVVIGMNGSRPSLTADSDFIAILPSDLEAVGLSAEPRKGETLCRFANSLHHEISAQADQLLAMCLRLLHQSRELIHLSKGMIRPLEAIAKAEGCLVIRESQGCKVDRCA
jgi:hypothetical protein